jgi:hypothetical protein
MTGPRGAHPTTPRLSDPGRAVCYCVIPRKLGMSAPGQAWTERKRCRPSIAESLSWNPAGQQSRPTKLGQQSEASLASAGATRAAKRRQRVTRPCDEPRKSRRGSRRGSFSGRPHRSAEVAWRGGPTGVGEQGMGTGGSQEPGRPCRFHTETGAGRPVDQPPGPGEGASEPPGAKRRAQRGSASRGGPKARGTSGRESERPTVPGKRGNRPGGTPWREGDAGARTFRRDRCQTHRGLRPSPHDRER